MCDKKDRPGATESEPYCRIEFRFKHPNGTSTIHSAECGLNTTILGLKGDLKHVVGVKPADQIWKYGDIHLENDKNLLYYGVEEEDQRRARPVIITIISQSSDAN